MTVRTDAGNKYRQPVTAATPAYAADGVRMEDAHAVKRLPKHHRDAVVVAVADGHGSVETSEGVFVGGRECADAACTTAVRRVAEFVGAEPSRVFEACQRAIAQALRSTVAHTTHGEAGVLRTTSAGRSTVLACGTTLSVAVVVPSRPSTFSWVGDSLGLLVRGGTVTLLGVPHSTGNVAEKERMRQSGATVDKNYYDYRVDGSRMRIAVSRTLGHAGHPGLSHTPETVRFTPLPGDRIVVATDGLWDVCSREKAGRLVAAAASEAEACDALLQVATSSTSPRDNVTIVCVFLPDNPSPGACCVVS